MKTRLKIIGGFAVGTVAGLVAGCQTYNFEPLAPLAIAQTTQANKVIAKALAPNIMIVVDKSGSMMKPVDPSNPACPTQGGVPCGTSGGGCGGSGICPCPAGCPTRMSDLQAAMANFLPVEEAVVRFGLDQLPKPNGGQCEPSALTDILVDIGDGGASLADDPVDNTNHAVAANNAIQAIVPSGGTPTAGTLGALTAYPPLLDPNRSSFVLLLTDGEPNCNSSNPNNCTTTACNCTSYTGVAPVAGACPGPAPACGCGNDPNQGICTTACIDTNGVVQSINSLRNEKVRTIVVGFGRETLAGTGTGTGFAPAALNAMALAGGFGRSCPMGTDAECNTGSQPDTCDTVSGKLCADGTAYCCNRKYYVALDKTELTNALVAITQSIVNATPCDWQLLATPSDASLLLVIINGTDVPATGSGGTVNWIYTAPTGSNPIPRVKFQGAVCTQLEAATPNNPVSLEFRIVQKL